MTDYLQLIAKKLAGEINDFEERALDDWVKDSKENELAYRRFEEFWTKGKYTLKVNGQDDAFRKLTKKIGIPYQEAPAKKKSNTGIWLKVAASITILMISGLSWLYFINQSDSPVAEVREETMIVKSNPRGQKSQVTLPDGTTVKLNAESYIEYSSDFRNERFVKLVGEAFFDVVRDTLHPFKVVSGDIQVMVLGTSFNVQAFPFEETMSVAVATGKVQVEKKHHHNGEQTSLLLPSEMLSIDHKTGEFKKRQFDPDQVLAWRDGVLTFEKASFEEISKRLERWYGVDIVVKRKTPISDGFTGRYENPTLETVLKGMSFSSDFSFKISGDTVLIN